MKFSIVMPTVGRVREVGRFLASLEAQTHRDFELIVADQSPDDRLVPVLSPYEAGFPILHLRRPGNRGAARARNAGLEHATADLVAFPDDDCRYPPDLLTKVDRFLVEHPELDGLTGRSIDENGCDSGGRFDVEPGPVEKANVWTRSIEYTMFLRKESTEGLWFDEHLGTGAGTAWGSGEGTDYLLRLMERGASLFYDPGVVAVHPRAAYDAGIINKAYAYGCGVGEVLRRHHYPARFKARWLIRPSGGALLSLAGMNLPEARYRWNTFRGRLKGLFP